MRTPANFDTSACIHLLRTVPLIALCGVLAWTGCATGSHSYYVSPRVIGRVVDQQSHQPIPGVRVMRLTGEMDASQDDQLKAGQKMRENTGERTDADGTFALTSEQSVALLRTLGWYSVTISFTHSGHVQLVTNFTQAHAVLSKDGEPVVNAGDILLAPVSR